MNQLYYSDNLQVLGEHIADESADLIYLDPPFNWKCDCNLLFKSPKGQASGAQIVAFEDTRCLNTHARREFDELLHQANNTQVTKMVRVEELPGAGTTDGYLTMIANRLLELHAAIGTTWMLSQPHHDCYETR